MKITITGTGLFDGDLDLDLDGEPLNGWDLNLIKKVSGVRAGELSEAFEAGDYDLIVAVAAIALKRSGRIAKNQALQAAEALADAAAGNILVTEESDALPPAEPQTESKPNAESETSGEGSSGSADPPETTPPPTGPQV